MRRVLVAVNSFEDAHVERLAAAVAGWGAWERIDQNTPEREYRAQLKQAEVVVGWPRADWLLDSPIRLFQLASAGYDAYLGAGLERKPDFTLCNARGVMSVAIAEHCVGMMLALTRRLPKLTRDAGRRGWDRLLPCGEVTGATACVVGLGDIGTEVARRCLGLGMRVTGVRRQAGQVHPLVETIYGAGALAEAVSEADHIFITVSGGPESDGLFSAALLDCLKPTAYLYNVSRGSVLDEPALVQRLLKGRIAGAGLDVFQEEPLPSLSPLWDLQNVIVTPHLAGRSTVVPDRLSQLAARNIVNHRMGRPLENAVMRSTPDLSATDVQAEPA